LPGAVPYESISLAIYRKLLKALVGGQLIARSCKPQGMTIRPRNTNRRMDIRGLDRTSNAPCYMDLLRHYLRLLANRKIKILNGKMEA
jgi:hypothetical protein